MLTMEDVQAVPQFSALAASDLESSVPGVFACGDVRLGLVKRMASAVGEGSMAIAFVHKYLQRSARQPSACPT